MAVCNLTMIEKYVINAFLQLQQNHTISIDHSNEVKRSTHAENKIKSEIKMNRRRNAIKNTTKTIPNNEISSHKAELSFY